MSGRQDKWANWLLHERFGGPKDLHEQMLRYLAPIRDRVLEGAKIKPGEAVLDIGCGDGLLGFAALDRVGPSGSVGFCDVSPDLVQRCRDLAIADQVDHQCEFITAALPDLDGVPAASADVVVMRSVLIYVQDKSAAVQSIHRVLRSGGRLSLFEPINSFGFPEPPGRLWGFDVSGMQALADKVDAVRSRYQPAEDPMVDFDERDLLDVVEGAGFGGVDLTFEARCGPSHMLEGLTLDTLLSRSPNPNLPTLGEILAQALEQQEVDLLRSRLAQQISEGAGRTREAVAYIRAQREG